MPLRRLKVEAFRCLDNVELELDGKRSYVFGANGAGKTSLLEAIYFLGRGRSFRTRETRKLVRWGSAQATVYAETRDESQSIGRLGASIGIGAGAVERQLNGRRGVSAGTLASALPVYVLDPGAHELIGGGPRGRRQFLDWGVFHVEHDYLDTWRRYRRALGQRNAGLKEGQPDALLAPWTQVLIEEGTAIDAARRRYLEQVAPILARLGQLLLGEPIEASYQRGWPQELELGDALAAASPRERASGITEVGVHRSDLRIRLAARGVRESASRGQQKLVAAALVLSQIEITATQRTPTLLVDDPAAELDQERVARILDALFAAPAQVVLTGLSREQLAPPADYPVFHVEQGNVRPML